MSEAAKTNQILQFASPIIAVVETVAVFAATLVLVRLLQRLPEVQAFRAAWPDDLFAVMFRWLPLLTIAAVVEASVRGRSPIAWGFSLNGGVAFHAQSALWLFVLGGTIPLALTLAAPPATQQMSAAAMALSLAGPLLAQEVFLSGYVNTRLQETWPPAIVPFLIAALFAAAHLNHLSSGELGPLFVGAMALQGWLWSSARAAGVSLLALAAAHAGLLLAYHAPAASLALIALLAALFGRNFSTWWASVTRP